MDHGRDLTLTWQRRGGSVHDVRRYVQSTGPHDHGSKHVWPCSVLCCGLLWPLSCRYEAMMERDGMGQKPYPSAAWSDY